MATIQKIVPNLWFDKNAEDAVNFYVSVFKNSEIVRTAYYGKAGFEQHKMKEGTLMTVDFKLEGQEFFALNAGPVFKFTEAISFVINCVDQEEIDYYWERLGEGGNPKSQQCGWLKDQFGLSWQVVPLAMADMMQSNDSQKTERLFAAMMQMKKLDLKKLQDAFNSAP